MKTILFSLVAIATLGLNHAHARTIADGFSTSIYCVDARPIRDAGLIVKVRTGGIAGITEILIQDQSIMGPRTFGSVIVAGQGTLSNGSYVYASRDAMLMIELSSTPEVKAYPARLVGTHLQRPFAHDLICRIVPQNQPEP